MAKLQYIRLGFREAKRHAIVGLKGDIRHEPRDAQAQKNLLAVGEVSPEEVSQLIATCVGTQYGSSPHYVDPSVEVHEFFPGRGRPGARWYIKLYFRQNIVFISVHR